MNYFKNYNNLDKIDEISDFFNAHNIENYDFITLWSLDTFLECDEFENIYDNTYSNDYDDDNDYNSDYYYKKVNKNSFLIKNSYINDFCENIKIIFLVEEKFIYFSLKYKLDKKYIYRHFYDEYDSWDIVKQIEIKKKVDEINKLTKLFKFNFEEKTYKDLYINWKYTLEWDFNKDFLIYSGFLFDMGRDIKILRMFFN